MLTKIKNSHKPLQNGASVSDFLSCLPKKKPKKKVKKRLFACGNNFYFY